MYQEAIKIDMKGKKEEKHNYVNCICIDNTIICLESL